MTTRNQIEHNFAEHKLDKSRKEKCEGIREQAKFLAEVIDELCPNSREKSLAITKLEETVMWALASIGRNE